MLEAAKITNKLSHSTGSITLSLSIGSYIDIQIYKKKYIEYP